MYNKGFDTIRKNLLIFEEKIKKRPETFLVNHIKNSIRKPLDIEVCSGKDYYRLHANYAKNDYLSAFFLTIPFYTEPYEGFQVEVLMDNTVDWTSLEHSFLAAKYVLSVAGKTSIDGLESSSLKGTFCGDPNLIVKDFSSFIELVSFIDSGHQLLKYNLDVFSKGSSLSFDPVGLFSCNYDTIYFFFGVRET